MKVSRNIHFILYGFMTILYGFCHWIQDLIIYNMNQNRVSQNIIGVNITPNSSQIKSFLITLFISILYAIKDIYQFSSK